MNNLKKQHYLIISYCIISLLSISGCGQATKDQINSSTSNQSADVQALNVSFANIKDQATAEKAVLDLQNYINKKTNKEVSITAANVNGQGSKLITLAMSTNAIKKLAALELKIRNSQTKTAGLSANSVSFVDDDSLISYDDYTQQQLNSAKQGLSSTDLANIINSMSAGSIKSAALKVLADIPALSATNIEIIRDQTLSNLPAIGNAGSDRLTPLESIVIGYIAASDDDGTKADGKVALQASQDQINGFIDAISTKLEQ